MNTQNETIVSNGINDQKSKEPGPISEPWRSILEHTDKMEEIWLGEMIAEAKLRNELHTGSINFVNAEKNELGQKQVDDE